MRLASRVTPRPVSNTRWVRAAYAPSVVLSSWEDLNPKAKAYNWLIALDQYVWSPKGWLTGSPNQVGSILFGTHFEQNNVWCSRSSPGCLATNSGQFHRNTVLVREWDLWYFIAPQMSMGAHFVWYDANNLVSGNPSPTKSDLRSEREPRAGRRLGQRHLELALHLVAERLPERKKGGARTSSPFFWRWSNPSGL